MAKKVKINDGLPKGIFICTSKAEDSDNICFDVNEISSLLEKLAANATTTTNP